MLQIARMTGNKKAGAACAQQAAPHGINTPLSKDEIAVTLKGGIEICQKIMY